MATINSRAWRIIENMTDNAPDDIYYALVQIATEQDRISRAEERERCIKIAQRWICDNCAHWQLGQFEYCSNCPAQEQIRKAMEGGNV